MVDYDKADEYLVFKLRVALIKHKLQVLDELLGSDLPMDVKNDYGKMIMGWIGNIANASDAEIIEMWKRATGCG